VPANYDRISKLGAAEGLNYLHLKLKFFCLAYLILANENMALYIALLTNRFSS